MKKRFLGLGLWAAGTLLVTAPAVVTSLGTTGCGGCVKGTCLCQDGASFAANAVPCDCDGLCSTHGGFCSLGDCTGDGGDAAADAMTDAAAEASGGKDGGLGQGAPCDLQDDLCGSGLKCCAEPTHMLDASTQDICVPPEDGGVCPQYP